MVHSGLNLSLIEAMSSKKIGQSKYHITKREISKSTDSCWFITLKHVFSSSFSCFLIDSLAAHRLFSHESYTRYGRSTFSGSPRRKFGLLSSSSCRYFRKWGSSKVRRWLATCIKICIQGWIEFTYSKDILKTLKWSRASHCYTRLVYSIIQIEMIEITKTLLVYIFKNWKRRDWINCNFF